MKVRLLRRIRKRFDIKYSNDKYDCVILNDKKSKQITGHPSVLWAMDWLCFKLGMFYQFNAWREKRDYKKGLNLFNKD